MCDGGNAVKVLITPGSRAENPLQVHV
uniref:Uncharacterized protein n=1 Tax=Anguilla anguilla TaxID=7936 RepID=A0A0E9UZH4_ANGAN